MTTSTVKWFDAEKGYGFIHHPNDGDDVFVHYSNIQTDDDFKTLQSDQRVRFELNDGPKGLHALDVEIVDADAADGSSQEAAEDGFDLSKIDPTAEVDPFSNRGPSSGSTT
jgi:CspA family cold shock protein